MRHATTSTTCTLALVAALFTACDKKPASPPKPQSSTTVAAATIPSGIVSDPSVPPASQAINEASAPASAGQDSAVTRPNDEGRKQEEAKAMRALRGENPSGTELDGAQKQQQ